VFGGKAGLESRLGNLRLRNEGVDKVLITIYPYSSGKNSTCDLLKKVSSVKDLPSLLTKYVFTIICLPFDVMTIRSYLMLKMRVDS
jgi:hypothetical protein